MSTTTAAPARDAQKSGDWIRTARLGEGHWCECFLARPVGCPDDWPTDYVVKQLKPAWRSDPMALAQLHREAQIGRETSHPNLIALLAANLNDETTHLVFPYVLGTSARQLLVCEQRIPIAFALWVIRQASEALEVLHRAGYRHGDIQPDNLLISPNWHVTVIDLGLARGADEDANYHQQWLTGTLGYAAPELFLAGSNVAPAADIYSLGATLYEFVTGVRPDQSEANQRWKHERSGPSEGRYVDLKHLCPIASTQLARLTREMLASNPNQRPSLSQLIARLRRLEMFHLADRSRMIA